MKKKEPSKRGVILVDSCGWIEYFSEGDKAEEYARYIEKADPESRITPTIVLYEVYKRIRTLYSEELALQAIGHIQHYTDVMDLTTDIAVIGAEISLTENIPMADAIILATAKKAEATVVTGDSHLEGRESVLFI